MKKIFLRIFTSVFVIVSVLAIAATAFAVTEEDYAWRYSKNTLKQSSTVKAAVRNVQADFNRNTHWNLSHDGIYGPNTASAAKDFQRSKGLQVDGQTGRNTKTILYPVRDILYNYY